jgi:hypothetical protein
MVDFYRTNDLHPDIPFFVPSCLFLNPSGSLSQPNFVQLYGHFADHGNFTA